MMRQKSGKYFNDQLLSIITNYSLLKFSDSMKI